MPTKLTLQIFLAMPHELLAEAAYGMLKRAPEAVFAPELEHALNDPDVKRSIQTLASKG